MSDVNIFEMTKDRPESEWASFKNIGDSVQGVYVGNRKAIDGYNNEQIVYELLDKKTNKIINVAIRTSKKPVIDIMSKCFFGQIVGFIYREDKKTKDGKSTFKSIDVREDPKIFDAEWVETFRARSQNTASGLPTNTPTTRDTEADRAFEAFGTDEPPFLSDEEYLKGIADMAREKLGVTEPSTVKDRVMEATDLAFTKVNYQEIYEKLKSM